MGDLVQNVIEGCGLGKEELRKGTWEGGFLTAQPLARSDYQMPASEQPQHLHTSEPGCGRIPDVGRLCSYLMLEARSHENVGMRQLADMRPVLNDGQCNCEF
jgi:hypothetical protein